MVTALTVLSIATFSLSQTTYGQGFVDLNFEQATIQAASAGYMPSDAYLALLATSAFPGWTVREDGTICNAVWGAPVALDETSVALVSSAYSPIQGNYSVQLSAYADAPSGYFHDSSISQSGLIPAGTLSLEFSITSGAQAGGVQANPMVTINGTPINLWEISQSGGVITMAGDVSSFAGTTATLAFLCEATQGGQFPTDENIFNLDNIQFSSSTVPEPNVSAFGVFGALLFAWCHRGMSRKEVKEVQPVIRMLLRLRRKSCKRAQGAASLCPSQH